MAAQATPVVLTGEHDPLPESQLWFGLTGGPAAFALRALVGWLVGAPVCEEWPLPACSTRTLAVRSARGRRYVVFGLRL
jgi:hypothetical protein